MHRSKFALPVLLAAYVLPASAQERAVDGLDAVIVTAQKRSQDLQDVPIAVTAISGETLQAARVNNVLDMQSLAPSLQVSTALGTARVFIRGIGLTNFAAGGESSVAYHVDGAVISRPAAQISGFYDLERIEILRGPQGTLYGRNATGGSINLITKRPTRQMEGYAELTGGNYSLLGTEGALSGPLIGDQLLGRIAFRTENRDGYGTNHFNGQDIDDANNFGFRGALSYVGSDIFKAFLTYSHYKQDDASGWYHMLGPGNPNVVPPEIARGGMIATNPRDLDSEVDISTRKTVDSVTAELTRDLADNVQLKSLTNYLYMKNNIDGDLGGTPVQFLAAKYFEYSHQLSQEIQLTFNTRNTSNLFGLYYFQEDIEAKTDIKGPPLYTDVLHRSFLTFYGNLESKSYAAFANSTWNVSDQLSITGGLRYSKDKKSDVGYNLIPVIAPPPPNNVDIVLPATRNADWSAWTPKLTVEYRPSSAMMVYGSIAKGYKAGVMNIGSAGAAVDPEYVWSYEVGLKDELLDHRLLLNAAVFHTSISDLQVQRPINGVLVTVNAAKATSQGIELETTARLGAGFTMHLNAAYLDAVYAEFITSNTTFTPNVLQDLAGNRLTNAPKFQGDLSFAYETALISDWSIDGQVRGIYVSDRFFNEFNESIAHQDATFNLNANIQVASSAHRFYVNLWGRNLTDEFVLSHVNVGSSALGFMRTATLMPPRTFGITVGSRF